MLMGDCMPQQARKALVSVCKYEMISLFALEDFADRFVTTYSGGMRRRLDVAVALMHRPKILF